MAVGVLIFVLSLILAIALFVGDDLSESTPTPEPAPTAATPGPTPTGDGTASLATGKRDTNPPGDDLLRNDLLRLSMSPLANGLPGLGPPAKAWTETPWKLTLLFGMCIAVGVIVWGAYVAKERGELWSEGDSGIQATLLGLAPVLLTVAASATIVIYILPIEVNRDAAGVAFDPDRAGQWEQWRSYLAPTIGLAIGVLVALALALLRSSHSSPSRIDPHITNEIVTRWLALDARQRDWCSDQPSAEDNNTRWNLAVIAACAEARDARDKIEWDLGLIAGTGQSVGPEWIEGTGFVDLWSRLHGAEEALFYVAPKDDLIGFGLVDEMRLKDSRIDNDDELLFKLRRAVSILGGNPYLTPGGATYEIDPTISAVEQAQQARSVLREIRHEINDYRDARRGGLVRARNQLISTGFMTAAAAYALLGVAIFAQVPQDFVIAAVVFYLVGAVIGLFNQLRISATNVGDQIQEDFGLARAQLLYSPVLSGLAGIAGVVVTALLYASLTGSVIVYQAPLEPTETPTPTDEAGAAIATPVTDVTDVSDTDTLAPTATPTVTPTPALAPLGVASPDQLPRLVDIFNLEVNRFGLIIAAVFGLLPGLLVDRLQSLGNRYKADLRSASSQESV